LTDEDVEEQNDQRLESRGSPIRITSPERCGRFAKFFNFDSLALL
jgi:hypothetical protein